MTVSESTADASDDPGTPVTATVIAPVSPAPTSVKVRIDAGGREVELETTDPATTVDSLAAVALTLWRATADAAHPVEGRGFGLIASERAGEQRTSSTMDWPVESPR